MQLQHIKDCPLAYVCHVVAIVYCSSSTMKNITKPICLYFSVESNTIFFPYKCHTNDQKDWKNYKSSPWFERFLLQVFWRNTAALCEEQILGSYSWNNVIHFSVWIPHKKVHLGMTQEWVNNDRTFISDSIVVVNLK